MRLKIVQAGEPVLRETARLLTPQEILSEEIQRLIRDMREAMHDAPGVGLAAPQIGQPFQLAVIEDREDLLKSYAAADLAERERRAVPFHVIINPVIAYSQRRNKKFLRRLPQPPRFFRRRSPRPHRPRRIPRRARPISLRPSHRLVRPHPPARNRSSPRRPLH